MSNLTPKPNGHPIKIVRDETPSVINASGKPGTLFYDVIPIDDRLPWLKKKLGEEVTEFLVDGGADELCDVYAIVRGLAVQMGLDDTYLENALSEDIRGSFNCGMMMYGHHEEFDNA